MTPRWRVAQQGVRLPMTLRLLAGCLNSQAYRQLQGQGHHRSARRHKTKHGWAPCHFLSSLIRIAPGSQVSSKGTRKPLPPSTARLLPPWKFYTLPFRAHMQAKPEQVDASSAPLGRQASRFPVVSVLDIRHWRWWRIADMEWTGHYYPYHPSAAAYMGQTRHFISYDSVLLLAS
jgi:hypothetical protein